MYNVSGSQTVIQSLIDTSSILVQADVHSSDVLTEIEEENNQPLSILIQADDELSNQIESENDQPLSISPLPLSVHTGVQPNDVSAEIEANDDSVLVQTDAHRIVELVDERPTDQTPTGALLGCNRFYGHRQGQKIKRTLNVAFNSPPARPKRKACRPSRFD